MELNAKEVVKILLNREKFKQKELAEILSKKIGKKYTAGSLSKKITRSSISYDEFVAIADILGYDVKVEKREIQIG